ncbi:MAG: hypothetical protein ACRD72_21335 [Candidatus Angelobacter sp.]
MTKAMTHRHASPKDAKATEEHTGPFPTSERTSASTDAAKPRLEDASAKAYFPEPSGKLFACKATSNTDNPIAETRMRAANARTLRHAGATKRGFEVSHRTQAQIREGMGKRYPASPMKNIGFFSVLILDRSQPDIPHY